MEDLAQSLHHVLAAAKRGGHSVTDRRQAIDDAVEEAIRRWEEASLAGRPITDPAAWAYRVAANAAKRLAARQSRRIGHGTEPPPTSGGDAEDALAWNCADGASATLRSWIELRRDSLTRKQLQVALTLARPGMSLRTAAKELAMDRTNLRRVFRRALQRLARA